MSARETFVVDPSDSDFVDDPVPTYARGRAEHPVYRHPGLPLVSLFRYNDIIEVLKDHGTWSSRFPLPANAEELGISEDRPQSMLGQDPPEHDRLRGFVNKVLTPGRLRRLEPRIREVARELMDDVLEQRRVDFVEAYAYPLPVIVIAEIIGVPIEDRGQFRIWSDTVVENLGEGVGGMPVDPDAVRQRIAVGQEMDEYFADLLEQRKREPRDDLLTHLVSAERDGDRLSQPEILTMLTVLLVAGNETTRNLIGNAVIQLLAHPEELARLRANPALMPSAVNEVLRFDSSVQATIRLALEPVEIRTEKIDAGESALLWLGSANRDEAIFPDPDRFDIAREPNHHLSFSFGVHYCLGSNLARLEMQIALAELLGRSRSFERTDDDSIWRSPSFILRGPKSLALEVVPG